MKRTVVIPVVLALILAVILMLWWSFREQKKFHREIHQHRVGFVYEVNDRTGVVNSVLLLEQRDKMHEYVAYYRRVLNGENPPIPIRIKTLPYDTVFIVGYAADSALVEIVSYYDYRALRGASYSRGWVMREFVHDTLFRSEIRLSQ